MPYKLSEDKRSVLIFKNGKWQLFAKHETKEQARKHLTALIMNVEHKYGK